MTGSTAEWPMNEWNYSSELAAPRATRFQILLDRILDPTKRRYRYCALIPLAFLTFGPYYCLTLPSALQIQIQQDLNMNAAEYSVFNSLSSWPNIVWCFLSGTLIDRFFSVRIGGPVFAISLLLGQIMFAAGAFYNIIWIMFIGRLLIGTGSEATIVVQKAYVAQWFPKNEQNLVYGLFASTTLLGPFLSQLTLVPIYDFIKTYTSGQKSLGITALLSSILIILAILSSFLLIPLDKRRVAVLKSANKASEQSKQKLSITIFFKFPIQLWLISLFCTSIFSANTTLINLGKKFLVDKYEESILVASAQSSAYFFGMVISAPIFGLLVNLTGYNLIWIVAGGVFAILNHSLLAFTYFSPSVVLLSMGMSAILVSVASSSILPETVKADQLAAAFGILQGVLNLGDSIFSIIGGNIIQEHGYFALELLNYYLSILTLVFALLLLFYNNYTNGTLNLSKKAREAKFPLSYAPPRLD